VTATLHPQETSKISIVDLNVVYDQDGSTVHAVGGLDLDIRENEFVCVMGASGSGKTTFLNALAGFVRPSSGSITVGGKQVRGPGADRAVVFQDDAVFPWMTVEDNVAFSQRVRGASKQHVASVTDRYIELVGLGDFRKAWPRQLSGGMRKRVDLARAYAADPEVLLLDEPFGSLDIITKEHMQESLHELWLADPRTIIFVTHDLEEALYLGDRIVILTPRPASVAAIYEPGLPAERNMSVKTTETFVALRREIADRIAGLSKEVQR
jgi:NitT/TauT family transport system ATP-binding protein